MCWERRHSPVQIRARAALAPVDAVVPMTECNIASGGAPCELCDAAKVRESVSYYLSLTAAVCGVEG